MDKEKKPTGGMRSPYMELHTELVIFEGMVGAGIYTPNHLFKKLVYILKLLRQATNKESPYES